MNNNNQNPLPLGMGSINEKENNEYVLTVFAPMKNESKNAKEWAESAKGIADQVVVLDTGSTDNTVEILKNCGVEVHASKQFDSKTDPSNFHFANARNECLKYCKGKWVLALDADERVCAQEGFREKLEQIDVKIDAMLIEVFFPETSFFAERLHLSRLKYVNAMHNALECTMRGEFPEISIKHIPGRHAPGRSQQRIGMAENYFKKNIRNNQKDTRSMFYLAQTYHDAGMNRDAVKYWERYLSISTWKDEAYQAALYLTKDYMALNKLDNAEKSMSKYIYCNPSRAEGFLLMGRIAYSQRRYHDSIDYFKQALACQNPRTQFFKELSAYTWAPWDSLSMSQYRAGLQEDAAASARKALDNNPPEKHRIRIENNLSFFPGTPEYYDRHWKNKPNPREAESKRLSLMCEMMESPRSVLDIGCGPGWAMAYLDGVEYTGLDISRQACNVVIEKGGRATTISSDIPREYFDGVLCGEVIEHLEDDEGMIRYANERLKDGGIMMVSVPMHAVMKDPSHVRDYREDEILSLVGKYFTVEHHENMWPWIIIKGRKNKC